mmetsp:Transcript_45809/g.52814  ORF Transcript_45809/g.52814 Transcript_45809/m.52814 type:complete len:232 (+) Transcript_45809:519-1214(+)
MPAKEVLWEWNDLIAIVKENANVTETENGSGITSAKEKENVRGTENATGSVEAPSVMTATVKEKIARENDQMVITVLVDLIQCLQTIKNLKPLLLRRLAVDIMDHELLPTGEARQKDSMRSTVRTITMHPLPPRMVPHRHQDIVNENVIVSVTEKEKESVPLATIEETLTDESDLEDTKTNWMTEILNVTKVAVEHQGNITSLDHQTTITVKAMSDILRNLTQWSVTGTGL